MEIDNKLILEYSKKLNILYVEDDHILRGINNRVFLNYFKEVDMAADGKEGLEKFLLYKQNNDKYYDLVISDINMPHMNGLEMGAAIIYENPQQPIIFNTADDETSFLQDAISLGIDGFLTKPINLNQLKMVLYKITRAINDRKLSQAFL